MLPRLVLCINFYSCLDASFYFGLLISGIYMEVNTLSNAIIENKKAVVSEIKEKFENASSAIVVEYRGLNVSQITNLRRKLHEENIEFKVYKNTMMRRAVEGTDYEGLQEALVGPNAVAFSDDAVAPSRVLAEFAKKHKKLILKAGVVDGNIVDQDEIKELSSLPNHDGMIAMLLGMFQSPVRSLAYAISQVAETRDENEVAATEEVVEAETQEEKTEEVAEEATEETAEESE